LCRNQRVPHDRYHVMNEDLKPAFQIILPMLEEAGIECSVYGGVSIAGHAGFFFRENDDVDAFVSDDSFEKAKAILEEVSKSHGLLFDPHEAQVETEKPKVNVHTSRGEELFSIIPVYLDEDSVVFKYKAGAEKYLPGILERVARHISGYRFFTPRSEFIKEIFLNHMNARSSKMKKKKYQLDAKHILTSDELRERGWVLDRI
jgi:hypothetical protein